MECEERLIAVEADVSISNDVQAFVDKTVNHFGRVDTDGALYMVSFNPVTSLIIVYTIKR